MIRMLVIIGFFWIQSSNATNIYTFLANKERMNYFVVPNETLQDKVTSHRQIWFRRFVDVVFVCLNLFIPRQKIKYLYINKVLVELVCNKF